MLEQAEPDTALPSVEPKKRGGLLQILGVWFGISAAVGCTIAAGIVRTPGDIARLLPDPFWFLGVWVIGGLYALCGASSLAELSVLIPCSGGQYNYSRRALGDYAGFIVGWSDWLSCCGTLAAVSIVVGEYSTKLFSVPEGMEKAIAIATLVSFAFLQSQGSKIGSIAQLATAFLKTAAFVVLVFACFLLGHPAPAATAPASSLPSGTGLFVSIMLAMQAVFYTMDGWNSVIYFGEEVKNPAKDVPRAIFGSVFSVMAIYLLLNAAVLYILPMSEIQGNKFCLGTVADKIFGSHGDTVIRSIMVVSLLSCINATQLFCSRILYAISQDGLFFKAAGKVSKGGTPVFALILSTLVAITFVLGSFERVIAMLSFFFVSNYALSYISLFILRRKEPNTPRAYKAWGYPWTSGIALVVSLAFLVGSIMADRENAPLALALIVSSYPVFKLFQKSSRIQG